MKLAFTITFKRGQKVVATVAGDDKDASSLTVAEVSEKVTEAEAFLERLTGLLVHIEQVL